VVDAGTDNRQAGGDVDRAAGVQGLHRHQALVVVGGYDEVEVAAGSAREDRIARPGATGIVAFVHEAAHGGGYHRFVLVAQAPPLTGVGVKPADGDARPGDAPAPANYPGGAASGAQDPLLAQGSRHLAQRHVDCRQRDPQAAAGKNHDGLLCGQAAQGGQVGSVAHVGEAGLEQGRLVERTGADRIEAPSEAATNSGGDLTDPGQPAPARIGLRVHRQRR